MPNRTGTTNLAGYAVLAVIGRGAASTIYKVRGPEDEAIFALKQVKRGNDPHGRQFEQVKTEYTIGRQLSHPNVRKIHELRKRRKRFKVVELLLVMEFLEGQTLEQARVEDLPRLCGIFSEVARGLHALHQAGFVHADVKPNNIMLCADGVKIFDLGQGCAMTTVKKRIQGTPDFIAPEQVVKMPLDARTDVFNLGATMYWCLTGRPYPTRLKSSRTDATLNLNAAHEVQTPRECNTQVPAALSNLVMECCRNNPGSRPRDMSAVLDGLDTAASLLRRRDEQAAKKRRR